MQCTAQDNTCSKTTSMYSCDECKQDYNTKKSLLFHIRAKHTSETKCLSNGNSTPWIVYRCDICNKSYSNKRSLLLQHIATKHSGEIFQCEICQKRASSKANLRKHLKLHQHEDETTKSVLVEHTFICNICEKGHRNRQALKKHIISNHTTYKCTECDIILYNTELVDHRPENIVKTTASYHKEVEDSGGFECQTCGIRFTSVVGVKAHYMSIHRKQKSCVDRSSHKVCCDDAHLTNSDSFEQHRCDKAKEVVSLLETYKQEYQGDFECKICKKPTRDKLSLMQHQIRCHRMDKQTCEFCNKTVKNADALLRHISYHVNMTYTCDECGVQLTSFNAFKCHRSSHKQSKKMRHPCNVCGSDFVSPTSLRSHSFHVHSIAEKGTETFACDVCDKVYIAKGALNTHKKTTHSTGRLHKCRCGKSYKTRDHLKQHQELAHGGERLECEVCGKMSMSRLHLKRHMIKHGEKRYACKECGKCFFSKVALSYHMNSHTGNRPYKCNVCGKGFTMAGARDRHMPIHTGEKRNKCDVCGMAFNQKCSLTRHVRLHTGEKPYKCELCGMSFTQGSSLTGHKKVHHGQEIPLAEK